MHVSLPNYQISGHETFVCRYAWLPKAIIEIEENPTLFKDDAGAMIRLGVGKNMVRSIRFWAEASQVIEQSSEGHVVTEFGQRLLGHDGHDLYLEHPQTLWLLHWKITTNNTKPIYYWQQMVNYWHRSEFSLSEAMQFLERALPSKIKSSSRRTLYDGLRVFVNSYVPTRGRKGAIAEDNLDSPLAELGLIRTIGERITNETSTREPIYAFNKEDKASISPELFTLCLVDFWRNRHPEEKTLAFRFASSVEHGPGQVFKLPELAVRTRLEELGNITGNALQYMESSSMPQVVLNREPNIMDLLDNIYSVLL